MYIYIYTVRQYAAPHELQNASDFSFDPTPPGLAWRSTSSCTPPAVLAPHPSPQGSSVVAAAGTCLCDYTKWSNRYYY